MPKASAKSRQHFVSKEFRSAKIKTISTHTKVKKIVPANVTFIPNYNEIINSMTTCWVGEITRAIESALVYYVLSTLYFQSTYISKNDQQFT